ncbi:hypothetical protein POM88_015227 [Heracleum sosnowskyi]|uniref:Uncharacterized protein n=1 Tax=Heracleum sosnowskyi TaxID=360622 RepID=A0AAD8MVY1_9APIA|nr:hypothetical protein POM88_015227 [Heracleum sosnowskyi]
MKISFIEKFTSPVILSPLENGKTVRGLAGIPYKGPVILVGYHMIVGLELFPLLSRFWINGDIHLRAISHPFMPDISTLDIVRVMGVVPVSPTNFYRLLYLNSHLLLYLGGIHEAFHRKGEEYKLFWPEQLESTVVLACWGSWCCTLTSNIQGFKPFLLRVWVSVSR